MPETMPSRQAVEQPTLKYVTSLASVEIAHEIAQVFLETPGEISWGDPTLWHQMWHDFRHGYTGDTVYVRVSRVTESSILSNKYLSILFYQTCFRMFSQTLSALSLGYRCRRRFQIICGWLLVRLLTFATFRSIISNNSNVLKKLHLKLEVFWLACMSSINAPFFDLLCSFGFLRGKFALSC